MKDVVGFAWTASFFGAVIVVQSVVVTVLSTFSHGTTDATAREAAKVGLLRPFGRRMSESHDAARGYRGLAAPSADLASYSSDGSL